MSIPDSPVVTDVLPGSAGRSAPSRARPHSLPAFSPPRRGFGVLAIMCIVLVIVADRLFYAQPLGWTAGLFAALLALAMTMRSDSYLRSWAGRLALLALAGLCLALVDHPGPLRVAMAILALATLAALNRHGWTTSATAWLVRWGESCSRCFVQLPMDMVVANRWTRAHGGQAARSLRTIGNWSIPILLSLVFVGLFALANPIISRWLQQASRSVSEVFTDFFKYVSIGRMALWLAFAFGTWSLLRGRVRWANSRNGIAEQSIAKPLVAPTSLNLPALLVRCLILFNIVFAIQMGLDFATMLTSGSLLPEDMDYRTYARRGAYPLVATALLAAAFVLITFPSGRQAESAMQTSGAMRWARRLVCLWIAQNILLTMSAGWRLWMYVEAFSLTHLRVAAAIWMLLVAIGLVAIIWRIIQHRTNVWLVRVNMVALLAVLYVCCFVNFDSMIAWYDVQRCMEVGGPGPHLDRTYIRSLGPEAIEPFQWLTRHASDSAYASNISEDVRSLESQLQSDLRSWQGWTWRRATIAAKAP